MPPKAYEILVKTTAFNPLKTVEHCAQLTKQLPPEVQNYAPPPPLSGTSLFSTLLTKPPSRPIGDWIGAAMMYSGIDEWIDRAPEPSRHCFSLTPTIVMISVHFSAPHPPHEAACMTGKTVFIGICSRNRWVLV